MLDKSPQTPSSSLSFEQLLGWVGRFTPQFKFRLLSLRRQFDMATFDSFVRETLTVFRKVMVDLARVPKGPERARKVYALIDEEFRATPPTGVSCAAGCGSCCKSFPKQITDDEADLLASLVRSGTAQIDLGELDLQVQYLSSKDPAEQKKGSNSPCLFLGPDDRCSVYADRPSVCRKYHVTSAPANCVSEDDGVVPRIDLMPELIVSAAMSLPDNGIGLMPLQISKRLEQTEASDAVGTT